MLQGLFSNMCSKEEVLKGFSITLALKSLALSIFQLFSYGFLSQRFLIRIVRCTKKEKNWKALMGWYI
jgi:hypothetical protein